MIVDGAAVGLTLVTPALDPRTLLLALYPGAPIPPMTHIAETAPPLVARVNHGRWIASCSCGVPRLPTPGCVVWLSLPLGFCVRCLNRPWGGGWRHITLPTPEVRAQIEAILLCRPNVGDRNWEPDESVADLLAQNREHGDPVPDLAPIESPVHGPSWRERVAPFGPLPKSPSRLRRLADRVRRR